MNIAIIDDSIEDARQLSSYAGKYFQSVHLDQKITLFTSAQEFLAVWHPEAFQLVFVEIYLGKEPAGLSIAQQIRRDDSRCLIVFTTRCRDFALKGYEVQAMDYLLKPISYSRFSRAMDYACQHLSQTSYYIEVKESRIMIRIPLDQILFTDYANHYILIHTTQRVVRTYMRFEDFARLLQPYPQFILCRRNCLINLDQVASLEKNEFLLKNGQQVPITHSLRSGIQQQYANYQFGGKPTPS